MQEAEYDICIVGGGCVDYFVEVGDFPRRGETIAANTYFNAPGGKGANQAVAAAKLIGKSIFAGQFGKDEAAESIEKHMNAAGVNTQFTRKLAGVKTAVGFITLTESGQNSIIIVGGANTHYSDLTKLPSEFCEAIDRSRIVLLQREIQNEINTLAAVYAKSKGKLVVLDVGGRDEPLAEELLASLDYVSPNETELERLIGTVSADVSEPIDQIIRSRLFTKYPNLKVLLKLGADGSAVITKDLYLKCQNITKFNEEILKEYSVVDVTGAGDCLMGSFFVRYAQLLGKAPIEEVYTKCMRFGNLSAFLCITQKGCIPAMPDIKTVEEFHRKYLSDLEI